jgi:hypothetical protein
MIRQNSIAFYVAREDGLKENRRENDSEIRFFYDIAIDFEVKQNWLVDDIRFRKAIWTCDVTRLTITNRDSDAQIVAINKYKINNEFPTRVLGEFDPLMAIQGKLNETIVPKIQENDKLIQEMSIDEDRKIELKADLVNNVLVINHPYSSIGLVKRTAKQNPTDANDASKTVTGMQPKTNTSASEIIKPAAVNTQAGSINKPRKGIN